MLDLTSNSTTDPEWRDVGLNYHLYIVILKSAIYNIKSIFNKNLRKINKDSKSSSI